MKKEINEIIKNIVREIENFNSSNISNQDELQNITQHGKSEKLKEFDSNIIEVLKTFGIQEYDPKNLEHEELVINLRINEYESIVTKEIQKIKTKINELINDLRKQSPDNDTIFFDSTFESYKDNYKVKRDDYLKNNIDVDVGFPFLGHLKIRQIIII